MSLVIPLTKRKADKLAATNSGVRRDVLLGVTIGTDDTDHPEQRIEWSYERTADSDGHLVPTPCVVRSDANTREVLAVYDGTLSTVIASITTYFIEWNSATSAPPATADWDTNTPSWTAGEYVWQRVDTTYGDGVVKVGTPVCIQGVSGNDGVGISSTAISYAKSTDGIDAPSTGWQSTIPTVAPTQYLWTKIEWTYTDNSSKTSYSVGMMGKTGDDGTGINSSVVSYQLASSATTAPIGTWSSSVLATTDDLPYLWTKTYLTYTDGTTSTAYSVASKGDKGDAGTPGTAGKDGVTPYFHIAYADTYSKNSDGTITVTGFSTTPRDTSDYIGTYVDENVTGSTSASSYSWHLTKGETGPQGIAGTNGADGTNEYLHIA